MNKCKICGKMFEARISLEKHVGTSYGKEKEQVHCPLLVYRCKYEGDDRFSEAALRRMYFDEMQSTPMMSELLKVEKKTLLSAMRYYGIRLRNGSDAAKVQAERDGIWNKGLTKYDHKSIQKYADSRRGRDNPFYTAPGFEVRLAKMKAHWQKMRRVACGNRNPKTTEDRMSKILDANGIQYVRNFCLRAGDSWRLYDFLIEGSLIIEMNGNYYHANPSMYNSDDVIVVARSRRRAQEIWDYDREKQTIADRAGYRFVVFWEKDFCGMSDADAINCIRNLIK